METTFSLLAVMLWCTWPDNGPNKKFSTTFVWGHPFSKYVSYDQFFNPLPRGRICMHLGLPLSSPSIPLVAYVLSGWPISQLKKHSNIVFTFKNRRKKNSCLVTRIVLFNTAGLRLLTFRILELFPSKYIALDLSHVISH